jgi:TnpA family transposase
MIVEAHAALPMAAFWGQGQSASSDGQFFLATEQGEAMNLINAKYGNVPGLKGYSHVSDQYAPFATQVIPATVSEAPYILDGLLMNDAGRRVRQHFADTGGFTDHVFAACALLASPQALYAEQRFSGHNVNIGVRQRREGTGRGFRG